MHAQKHIGIIKVFFPIRGYGWVTEVQPDGTSEDHFLHITHCKSFKPQTGQIVCFFLMKSAKGMQCMNAQLFAEPAPEPSSAAEVLAGKVSK